MKTNPDRDAWWAAWRDARVAMSLGWDLALPIFGGTLLGHFLDRWLQTRYVFTLGLLVLGIGIGFYNVAQTIRRVIERDRQNAEREEREDV
ncbi:MAG: AtpZ/AtpI family protein [Anaerolineae bacterium]|jgi:ATP synthase protein I|nr:AtpZ/AtpI family protein [Anaerolineae bacterium]MDH7474236.1 AtpZ/AtpI family protein [Anaerolineae bacterium]